VRVHEPEVGHASLEARGLRFAYLEEGEGPAVLLVHGFPDTAHTWDAFRPALAAAGYRAVSPWTRGIAPTEAPDRDTAGDDLGRDVLGWMDALGVERAVLIGHDWGASAVYSAAGLAPERVDKLVAMAIPHPAAIRFRPVDAWRARHFVTLRLPGAAARFRAGDYAGVDALIRRWAPSWAWPEGELQAVKNAYAAPGCLDAALGYYRGFSPSLPEGLRAKIPVPTLAIAGTEDITPLDAFEQARRRFTGPYEVLQIGCGHFPHRERQREVLDAVLTFLAD